MGLLDYIKSAWEWVKSSIQKLWNKFKAFLVKVANWANTVMGVLRDMVRKAMRGIQNLKEKIKNGLKKFFLIFIPKKSTGDAFKDKIKQADREGKKGNIDVPADAIFDDPQTSDYDMFMVQTDSDLNSENIHSITADEISSDLRTRAMANEVSEINLKF